MKRPRASRFHSLAEVLALVALLGGGCELVGELPERSFHTGHGGGVLAIAFSPDGRWLATAGLDDRVTLWEVATERAVRSWEGTAPVLFSPDGRWLAAGSEQGVKIWEVATWKGVSTLRGPVAFSRDGRWLVSGSDDSKLKLREVATGAERGTLKLPELPAEGEPTVVAAFSPDGRWLAAATHSQIKLWEISLDVARRVGGSVLRAREREDVLFHPYLETLAFSPDGRWLAAGGTSEPGITIWEVGSWREVRTLTGYPKGSAIAFSPDGRRLAAASGLTVKVWEVATGAEVRSISGFISPIGDSASDVAFSPDGRWLVVSDMDGFLLFWEVGPPR